MMLMQFTYTGLTKAHRLRDVTIIRSLFQPVAPPLLTVVTAPVETADLGPGVTFSV